MTIRRTSFYICLILLAPIAILAGIIRTLEEYLTMFIRFMDCQLRKLY